MPFIISIYFCLFEPDLKVFYNNPHNKYFNYYVYIKIRFCTGLNRGH